MPTKVVDLSARSSIIRDEPWLLHFWECTPEEYQIFLRDPRKFLRDIGIELSDDCRIETVLANHDWLAMSGGLATHPHDDGDDSPDPPPSGPLICNVGNGGGVYAFYRVTTFGHNEEDIGKVDKSLLHPSSEEKKYGT